MLLDKSNLTLLCLKFLPGKNITAILVAELCIPQLDGTFDIGPAVDCKAETILPS